MALPSRSVSMLAIAIALGGGIAALIAACGLYDTSLLLPALDAAPAEAAALPDADVDAYACAHASPPKAPSNEDGTEDLDLVFGGTFLRFSGGGSRSVPAPPRSYDLDNLCTCPEKEACTPAGTGKHCDGDGGADNAAGALFTELSTLAPTAFGDDAVSAGLRAGNRNILFRLRSYNGGKDDKQVTFIAFASNGLVDHLAPDGGGVAPRFDGTDVWTLDPSSLLGGNSIDGGATCEGNDGVCVPLFADTRAYVSGGVLVARLDFPLAFGSGDSTVVLRLQGTLVTATLTRAQDGSFHIDDGQVVGRWATSELLTSLGGVHDPLVLGSFLCGDAGAYPNLKQRVCGAADLAVDPSLDGTGTPCGAISAAFGFSATRAHLGPIHAAPTNPSPCGASYSDSCP